MGFFLCDNARMKNVREFNRILFRWHKKHYRPMPWRPKTRAARVRLDPYRILVSEIMLQQTQVDRVRGKYAGFLRKFPTVWALARAPLGEVLRVWSGLGYNRRAKYLHLSAKKVFKEHKGKFPDTFEELVKLPGVGISTAGALLAFSFGQDVAMVDTNIRRILVRSFFPPKADPPLAGTRGRERPSDKKLYAFAASIIPKGKGRMWNYAMLDLGATLCSARNHKSECPLTPLHGEVGDFVHKKPQKKFAGSHRFYRGSLLAVLSQKKRVAETELPRFLGLKAEATRSLVAALEQEGLLIRRGAFVMLPG